MEAKTKNFGMKKVFKIAAIVILAIFLVLIRAYENILFL